MARPPSALDNVRASVRRIQLTVGLGFVALILGSIVAMPLMVRVGARAAAMGGVVLFLAGTVIPRLWILGALPLLCYATARVIDLKPVHTAVGAALTGELMLLAIETLSGGVAPLLENKLLLVMRLVTALVGIGLSMFAITSARAHLEASQEKAQKKALDRKSEYDAFLEEAQRVADLKDKPVTAETAPATPEKPPESPPS